MGQNIVVLSLTDFQFRCVEPPEQHLGNQSINLSGTCLVG